MCIFAIESDFMRIFRHYILFLLLFFLAPVFMHASTVWNAKNIEMVYLKDRTQYVCDPENLVDRNYRDSANYFCRLLEDSCGVQTVFVIVGRVEDADCFRMTQDIGNSYGVGDRKTRRGLVVVVSVEDHKYFIAPGMGLEGELTDVDCDDIGRYCIAKNMKNDNPGQAVLSTCKALYNKVEHGKTGNSDIDGQAEGGISLFDILVLLIIFGPVIVPFFLWILETYGLYHPRKHHHTHHNDDDDWFPPFIFGGGGGLGHGGFDGPTGGSFGGGSFGGGGAGGGW